MTSATERLRALLDERGVEYKTHDIIVGKAVTWTGSVCNWVALPDERGLAVGVYKDYLTPKQAIAATLGMKAKSHPYGYEPDTGAFDATRCECGCINDISATYCNDCGGEIEIDMNAEKEIYHTPAHMVFAEKHDDGSLEFAGKQYIAATLGERHPYQQRIIGDGSNWGEIMRDAYDELMAAANESCTPDELAELKAHIAATLGNAGIDDALALLDEMNEQGRIEYEDYSRLHDAIATLGSERGTCHAESDLSEWVCSECQCWIPLGLTPENIMHASEWRYCPHCGAKVEVG